MCVVSAVGDDWSGRIRPWITPISPIYPNKLQPTPDYRIDTLEKSVEELKKLVLQMREELLAAKAQDIAEGNPDCEMEEKVALLKAFAKAFGVSLEDVFPDD